MLPALLTAVAVSSAEQMKSPRRNGPTRTPSVAAPSACSATTLMARAARTAKISAPVNTSHGSQRNWVPDKSPISQNTMPRKRLSGATDNIKVISAPQPEATITPVSNRNGALPSTTPLLRSRRASTSNSKATASAPANAAASIIQAALKNSIAASAPTAAPPDTPST